MPVGAVIAILLLSACGVSRAAAPDRAEQLLSATPPRSVACAPEAYPPGLPDVAAVVDTAMLAAGVRGLLGQEPPPAGYVLLTLAFDPAGANIRRDPIEHSTRPMVVDSVQRLVFAARRQVHEAEQEWGVRLRIDLAEPVLMRVGRREFCPPVARDRELDAAMHGFHPQGVRYRRGVRERVIHMQARVNASGLVTSAQVARGELRGSSLERDIAQHLRQFLFVPATIDGVPTAAWVQIPVRVRA